jgi:hypothetical protein
MRVGIPEAIASDAKQGMKIRAIAGFLGQAILPAAHRRSLQMIGVLHAVVHIFERPIVNLARRKNGIGFAGNDRSRERLDLLVDNHVRGRLQIRGQRGAFRIGQRTRLRRIDRVANLCARQVELFLNCDGTVARRADLRVAHAVPPILHRNAGGHVEIANHGNGVPLRHREPDAHGLGALGHLYLKLVFARNVACFGCSAFPTSPPGTPADIPSATQTIAPAKTERFNRNFWKFMNSSSGAQHERAT